MRHLITEPQDAYHWESSEADWEEFYAYCMEFEQRYMEEAFEESNRELAAIESPI